MYPVCTERPANSQSHQTIVTPRASVPEVPNGLMGTPDDDYFLAPAFSLAQRFNCAWRIFSRAATDIFRRLRTMVLTSALSTSRTFETADETSVPARAARCGKCWMRA